MSNPKMNFCQSSPKIAAPRAEGNFERFLIESYFNKEEIGTYSQARLTITFLLFFIKVLCIKT